MYCGQLVRLRAPEVSDLSDMMKHINTYETRQFLLNKLPISQKAEQTWLERAAVYDPWRDGQVVFVIEDKNSHELLGTAGLHNISPQSRSAELGIWIHDPENCSRGYGTDAVRVTLWIAFHLLGLESVMLTCLDTNLRAQRAYEKAGFRKVGILRKHMMSSGQLHDVVVMDITREDFMAAYPPGSTVGDCSRVHA
ncbi:MAG: GNAT family protein [Candidatus Thorarchaeota archaeon]